MRPLLRLEQPLNNSLANRLTRWPQVGGLEAISQSGKRLKKIGKGDTLEDMKGTQFMSAAEKQRVLKQWETFLKHGCQAQHFTKPLYHHLIQHCSFIAHYDRGGFYSTYFERGDDTAHFLTQFDNRNGVPNSIEYQMAYWYLDGDYNDINSAMCRTAVKYIDALTQKAAKSQRDADIDKARRLLSRHGIPLSV